MFAVGFYTLFLRVVSFDFYLALFFAGQWLTWWGMANRAWIRKKVGDMQAQVRNKIVKEKVR
ncbi:hypothetical protein HDU91_006740, partial [Kappamyces sp. JEL0680]